MCICPCGHVGICEQAREARPKIVIVGAGRRLLHRVSRGSGMRNGGGKEGDAMLIERRIDCLLWILLRLRPREYTI
eukprot:564570-Prymnesium_polylepis.1